MLARGLAILTLLVPFVTASEKACTIHDSGKFYDLNPLKSSQDYEFKTEEGHKFYMNVCRGVLTDTWNIEVPSASNVAGFIRRDHGDFSIGTVNTTLAVKDGDIIMQLSEGTQCPHSEMLGSAMIRFLCDTSVYAAGQPVLIDQFPSDDENACHFNLEWRTHYACPTGEGGIFSGIFISLFIAFIFIIMIYVVSSTLYNRFVLHRSGFDQMPSFAPSHIADLLATFGDFIISSINNLRRSRPSDLNPFSHHWSLADQDHSIRRAARRDFGLREEEEAMVGSREEAEYERDVLLEDDGNVWSADLEPELENAKPSGMDDQGIIRL